MLATAFTDQVQLRVTATIFTRGESVLGSTLETVPAMEVQEMEIQAGIQYLA